MSISKIQDIHFFSRASDCISHFEKTHWTKKALSLIQSFGNYFVYLCYHLPLLVLHRIHVLKMPYTTAVDFSKPQLVVCLHGLNSHPIQFKKIIHEMHKRNLSQTNIYIPPILERGNASLDEVIKPILTVIKKWSKRSGEKKLVLLGISNGSRIAKALSHAETLKNIEEIRFISIVGANRGSSLVDLAHKCHLSWLISKNIAVEMPTYSIRNTQLHTDWIASLKNFPKIRRDFTLIAALHDAVIPNYDSTLMDIPDQNTRYAIIPGHGHNSIVKKMAKTVAEIILP